MLTIQSASALFMMETLCCKSSFFLFEELLLESASSEVRVMKTSISAASSKDFNFKEISKLMSFSKVPSTPTFPESKPPCPGSMITVKDAGDEWICPENAD